MVNQTTAEALNLPANATSIRENITDTFSCENRTYGYYADVDNECQLFHVCLPTQTTTGRNITYKFSFICPKETMFNQEVLVCTRPRESIPCEESPSFYDLNMEIGKIADPDVNREDFDINTNKQTENIPVKENVSIKKQNRNQNRKKQNIIMDALLKEAEEQMDMNEEINEKPIDIDIEPEAKVEVTPYNPEVTLPTIQYKPEMIMEKVQHRPEMQVGKIQNAPKVKIETAQYDSEPKIEAVLYEPEINHEPSEYKPNTPEINDELENTRWGSDRSNKRTGRKMWRGSMKFKV
ncbi:jg4892 [Pararge aegeria aegeria]|uniref:Jg4892 protein n=1 Tax=Pararge aegeria aegeria TaxID=348720 RepID=A0A8S4RLY4_9NEOP|nr:jg4892 [Pararge aegeria aegeria]